MNEGRAVGETTALRGQSIVYPDGREASVMCGFDSMVTALDVEGEYELAADVYFEIDGELLYVEDSELYFTITVKEGEGGFGIPGFPQIAIVFGLGLTAVMLQNTRKR